MFTVWSALALIPTFVVWVSMMHWMHEWHLKVWLGSKVQGGQLALS